MRFPMSAAILLAWLSAFALAQSYPSATEILEQLPPCAVRNQLTPLSPYSPEYSRLKRDQILTRHV